MHGVGDLGVVDPSQVRQRDSGIGVRELALNYDQRAFSGHLDGVAVPELMGANRRLILAMAAVER